MINDEQENNTATLDPEETPAVETPAEEAEDVASNEEASE